MRRESKGVFTTMNHAETTPSAPRFNGIHTDDGESMRLKFSATQKTGALHLGYHVEFLLQV